MPTTHVVASGECMSSIAARYRFRDYRTIYDDPANAPLRALRPDPNVLYRGDEVVIPDRVERREDAPTERRHKFVTRSSQTMLRLRVDTLRVLAYELVLEDGAKHLGQTDGQSTIEHRIAPSLRRAWLSLWPAVLGEEGRASATTIALAVGGLDPVTEISGVQGRLQNLGHFDGHPGDAFGASTESAIARFETSLGIPPTGALTDSVRALLVAHHDG